MKGPAGLLSSMASVCCCILCALCCACEGCTLHRCHEVEAMFKARSLMIDCIKEIERLDREKRKQYLLDKFRSFQVRITKRKKWKFVILAGQGDNMHIVCKRGFCRAYAVSHWYVEDLVEKLKKGEVSVLSHLNHMPAIPSSVARDSRLETFAASFGINLTPIQIGNLCLSQSVPQLMTAAWMQYYFSLIGDQVPNSDHEIHLEPVPKYKVWEEYKFDMDAIDEPALELNTFLKIWKNVFPYVKVRKYKSSCGHCNLCATLGEKRRQFRDRDGREEVTNLFALHRLSTVGERRAYYDRRMEAQLTRHMFLSTIADGMQQNHCFLPWFGNNKMPPIHIKQHLQGVLMHGHNMTVYRTYSNIGGGANLAIHTWLLSLEAYYEAHDHRLPPVLYHQIDGGPENANTEFYGICALLVASGLVDRVVLTRLPVGHTHEDIDGCFALIWRRLRDAFVYTRDKFKKLIEDALSSKVKVIVKELFVIPDYEKAMHGCFDPQFGRFAKEEWAQSQFMFEKVPVSDDHPMGVKTTYRAYCQDEFIEIVEDPECEKSLCGLIPQRCEVHTHPLPGEAPLNVIRSFPSGDFAPSPFITGSRALTEALCKKMINQFATSKPKVAAEWQEFLDSSPQSDDAQEYVATHPESMHVPFCDIMFGATGVSGDTVNPRERGPRTHGRPAPGGMRTVETTTSVLHSGNKKSKESAPSRRLIRDEHGILLEEPVGVLNAAYPGRSARAATRGRGRGRGGRGGRGRGVVAAEASGRRGVAAEAIIEEESVASSSEEEEMHICLPCAPTFVLGELVVNVHKLRGVISKCNDDGTYDVRYNNGRTDSSVAARLLKQYVAPPGKLCVCEHYVSYVS
jgi:hypothetical protein